MKYILWLDCVRIILQMNLYIDVLNCVDFDMIFNLCYDIQELCESDYDVLHTMIYDYLMQLYIYPSRTNDNKSLGSTK